MQQNGNNHGVIIAMRVAVMLVVCVVLVLAFPTTGNFKYEYRKGMPWRYESLNAPFDFPIYKSLDELNEERESLKKSIIPIFNFDNTESDKLQEKFYYDVSDIIGPSHSIESRYIVNALKDVYKMGIMKLVDTILPSSKIKLVEDNVGHDVDFSSVYTPKTAYKHITDIVTNSGLPITLVEKLLTSDVSKYIVTNLRYDETKTRADYLNAFKSISLTRGMVQKDERIIGKRDLVTPEKIKILNSLKQEYQKNFGSYSDRMKSLVGRILIVLVSMLIFSIYLFYSKKIVFNKMHTKEFIFLYAMFTLTVLSVAVGYYQNFNLMLIPILFFTIVVNILIGSRSALYLLVSTGILASFYAPDSFQYLFMQIAAGVVAIFSLSQMQRRGQLFLSIFLIFITYVVVYISSVFLESGELQLTNLYAIAWLFINCLLLMLTYPAIYIFERLFGFTSEITLLELSNPNHPALRELIKTAPGTFQHSFMVANLAEEAAYKIGCNPLLARTGALYHDIGKSYDPIFFIENQSGGINPHDNCDFEVSAQHIIAHVSKGVEIAKKYNLPEVIIDFIKTHHGRSKVKFFYNSFKNKYPDRVIDDSLFTYEGPDPVTKECSILMMADAVEAVSRTLENKTEENINKLVNDIIDGQVNDGRFKMSDITFRDIDQIKKVFVEMLCNIYHSRISYPTIK